MVLSMVVEVVRDRAEILRVDGCSPESQDGEEDGQHGWRFWQRDDTAIYRIAEEPYGKYTLTADKMTKSDRGASFAG